MLSQLQATPTASRLTVTSGKPDSLDVFMNYAVWESVAHFRAAFSHPDFKDALERYPASAVASPHLFSRLTVPNLCVGP